MQTHFTIDCVILTFDEGQLKVLLAERNEYPYKDWWALPGYFVNKYEEMADAVARILFEMTGLKDIYMDQLAAFAGVKRHPEGRILTVAYMALVQMEEVKNKISSGSTYMRQLKWFPVTELPDLAFDHKDIIELSLDRLKKTVTFSTTPYELLPAKFTLTQLQQVYEALLHKQLDKRNFRKKINNLGYLKELNEFQKGVSYRAAKLYSFDKKKFHKIFSQD
ncbi:DNA mismatch repair protein MutT [Sphingobacterium mizutaii NBRC 14946 = DSM 11724]|uniref:Bifunctional nicotinamide mononucleotide adenylyltransferase/ADP-ribose pyrophosphatase n=2 Tax=Sphingobacterium mizutaii TaxID=1010 RepID=A0AAJ4XCN9_9SPHI|nr:NUDIX domain-containing protein [Sphingobacterium mizutaii]GEM69569.1 DNA mismatch repair protein MutT [Sphingobacterium mizutaii NBRC 14946 = DSM 11724]SDL26718.1 8-oxo-dGTP diphosphatase [Sphingobacterium mizutaii]SNV53428.1 bifunctional nicotinamide mononucleotide adenylyltransferase/ADP-ribose pyrophosphatase [Sphingobacterium mizutaii]